MNDKQNIPKENSLPDQEGGKEQTANSSENSARIKEEPKTIPRPQMQSQTSHIEPQTENMEVHKHPHHVTHKKKWGEYFLEFLMIFLAVTMGFFAETIRETGTEHKRAREFAASMLKDLQQDSAQIKSYIEYFNIAANNIDTLMRLLAVAEPKDIPSGKLYWYGLWGGAHLDFVPNDATLQQMKSSGSIRYFKRSVADAVAKYDQLCRRIQLNEERREGVYFEVRKTRAQIFDFRYNDKANDVSRALRKNGDYNEVDSFMKTNPPLLSYDRILFNQYIELVRSRFIRTSNIVIADSLLNSASVLIRDLQREYDLKK